MGVGACFHSPQVNYVGFHKGAVADPLLFDGDDRKDWNILMGVNLVPGIGNLIAGGFHILAARPPSQGGSWNKRVLARGITELTVVGGICLAAVDVIVTAGRLSTPQPVKGLYKRL